MEQSRESKRLEPRVDFNSNVDVSVMETTLTDEKDDEEEDEEEKEEYKIVEKSHNNRFIKRNKRLPTQISGVDNTFIAIEPKSGKEILWHERILSENKNERESRFLTIAKKLKKQSHPFLVRFLDAWIKIETGQRKLIFLNERLDDGTLKQFLCNSTSRSKHIWRRHVGQLLSVLNYLHRLGITHGNLRKEDIYYQSSGVLKVGPFMLDAFFGQKTHPSDIYAFGILALEIAVWTLAIDSQASTEEEKVKLMLSQLTDPQQRSFIEACVDPNPTNRPKIKALLNHPAVTEVPSLKLLSAKVVVSSLKPQPPQEEPATTTSANATEGATSITTASGKVENVTVFVQLMDDYVGHLEDDTAIVEIVIPAEQVTKVRVWKDFRTTFSSIPKYLEDVKSGFYPFLGYRFGGSAADQEEEDEGPINAIIIDNVTGQPHITSVSSAASSSTSRKHSNSVLSNIDTPPTRHLSTTLHEIPDPHQVIPVSVNQLNDLAITTACAAAAATFNSLVNSSQLKPASKFPFTTTSSKLIPTSSNNDQANLMNGDSEMRRRSLPNSFNNCVISTNQLKEYVKSMLNGVVATSRETGPPIGISAANNIPCELTKVPYSVLQQTATNAREKRVRQQSACLHPPDKDFPGNAAVPKLPTFQGRIIRATPSQNVPHTPYASIVSTLTQGAAISLASAIGNIATAVVATNSTGEHLAEYDDLSDAELSTDDGQNDSDTDDDENEDDDGKGAGGGERCFVGVPQVVHVAPPTQAPTTPALFTHCQYAYIGTGRWQVYVQMWFVEERLKREAYLQVLENEWHDYDRIADLFEGSKCLSSNDRVILVRLLAMARHNIPLIEGELLYPCFSTEDNGGIYAQEFYSKLVTLHFHQQAQQLMVQAGQQLDAHGAIPSTTRGGVEPLVTSQHHPSSVATNGLTSLGQSTVYTSTAPTLPMTLDAAAVPTLLPSGAMTATSDACHTSFSPSCLAPDSCPNELEDLIKTQRIQMNGDPSSNIVMLPQASSSVVPPATTTTCADIPTGMMPTYGSSVASPPVQTVVPTNLLKSTTATNATNSVSLASESSASVGTTGGSAGARAVEMLDVGCLAPENAMCALCDRHDYLHRTDLPNYLTSPCYHCRESFAREAKVSPEDLFDLHLQHNVPWPAFLQARFNIPPDGRSTEDLIAYDCRWRCREPCTCHPDISFPPCVEFPWFYAKIPTAAVTDTTAPASCSSAEKVPPSANPDSEQAPLPPSQQQSLGGDSSTDHSSTTSNNPPSSLPTATSMAANSASTEIKSVQHQHIYTPSGHQTTTSSLSQHSKMGVQSTETTASTSKHQHLHSTLLPCASRHARGALGPPQCCDPIGWPFASSGDLPLPQHSHNSLPPEREQSPAQSSNPQSAVVEP